MPLSLPEIPKPDLEDAWKPWAEKLAVFLEDVAFIISAPVEFVAGNNGLRHEQTFLNVSSPKTVTHNLGDRPLVQIVDRFGALVEVDVTHTSVNAFTISGWSGKKTLTVVAISGRFRHDQNLAAVTTPQTVTHSLGDRPLVQVLLSTVVTEVDLQHTSTNAFALAGWGGSQTFDVISITGIARFDNNLVGVSSPQVLKHKLGALPIIQTLDGSGNRVDVDVRHNSVNKATISGWSGSINLRAICAIF